MDETPSLGPPNGCATLPALDGLLTRRNPESLARLAVIAELRSHSDG